MTKPGMAQLLPLVATPAVRLLRERTMRCAESVNQISSTAFLHFLELANKTAQ